MNKQLASAIIKQHKILLISRWEKEVRKQIKIAEKTYQASLVDTIPVFLDHLAESLSLHQDKKLAYDGSSIPLEHGGERARLTAFTPEHIVKEYQILRVTVITLLKEQGLLDEEINELITLAIENAAMYSSRGFFETFMSLREHFMLTLSHDLRSPLTMAKVASEFIIRDPSNSDQVVSLGQKIFSSLERIDKMIQSLLDASRLKMGEKLSFNFGSADLVQIIRDVINEYNVTNAERFILISPDKVQGVWVPDAIKRMLENLISNALKYGSSAKPVTIEVEVEFSRTLISIHNEGSFISPEDQTRLFTLFKQLQKGRRGAHTKGWGIGLMLVKGVVEGHGGGVSIESDEVKGTSFIIDLPLNSEEAVKASPIPAQSSPDIKNHLKA